MHEIEIEIIKKTESARILAQKYVRYRTSHNKEDIENVNSKKCFPVESRQADIMFQVIVLNCNTLTKLAKELNLSMPSLSIIISKMVKNNIFTKEYDTNSDGREVLIVPTKIGIEQFNLMKKIIMSNHINFAKSLSTKELKIYNTSSKKFAEGLMNYGVLPIPEDMPIEESAELIFYNCFIVKKLFETKHRTVTNFFEKEFAITKKEFVILMTIFDNKVNTPSSIAKILNTTESTISTQLKKLVEKQYLQKEKSTEDARKTFFHVTDEGNELLIKTKEIFTNEFITVLENFKQEEKLNIIKGLDNLIILFELLLKHNH